MNLIVLIAFLALLLAPRVSGGAALERLRLGSASKTSAVLYLPAMAAEEKGFWKQNGLDIEFLPFDAGTSLYQGMAAGSIPLGMGSAISEIQAAVRGVAIVIVSELSTEEEDFYLWVNADSSLREAKELRGTKIGVPRLGGASYAYARLVAKALNLEGNVRLVALGGRAGAIAAIKAKKIDSVVGALTMLNMKYSGDIREFIRVRDYLPKDWIGSVVSVQKEFLRKDPEAVRPVVKAMVQTTNFLKEDPRWSIEKIKSFQRLPEPGARQIYEGLSFSADGKINRKGLENLINFLIEYGLVRKGEIGPLETFYITRFTG